MRYIKLSPLVVLWVAVGFDPFTVEAQPRPVLEPDTPPHTDTRTSQVGNNFHPGDCWEVVTRFIDIRDHWRTDEGDTPIVFSTNPNGATNGQILPLVSQFQTCRFIVDMPMPQNEGGKSFHTHAGPALQTPHLHTPPDDARPSLATWHQLAVGVPNLNLFAGGSSSASGAGHAVLAPGLSTAPNKGELANSGKAAPAGQPIWVLRTWGTVVDGFRFIWGQCIEGNQIQYPGDPGFCTFVYHGLNLTIQDISDRISQSRVPYERRWGTRERRKCREWLRERSDLSDLHIPLMDLGWGAVPRRTRKRRKGLVPTSAPAD
jgi:hypothetical protein